MTIEAHLKTSKRLFEVLPESVIWLTKSQFEEFLSISASTRKSDQSILVFLGLLPKSVQAYRKLGYSIDEMTPLWEFRQLQNRTDRDYAITNIKQLMELIDEYQRQRTDRTDAATTAA